MMASVCVVASQRSLLVKSLKRSSTSSMTNASSLMIMQVALSLVNSGSNSKPSWAKKLTDLLRSLTGRLTNVFRDMGSSAGGVWWVS